MFIWFFSAATSTLAVGVQSWKTMQVWENQYLSRSVAQKKTHSKPFLTSFPQRRMRILNVFVPNQFFFFFVTVSVLRPLLVPRRCFGKNLRNSCGVKSYYLRAVVHILVVLFDRVYVVICVKKDVKGSIERKTVSWVVMVFEFFSNMQIRLWPRKKHWFIHFMKWK